MVVKYEEIKGFPLPNNCSFRLLCSIISIDPTGIFCANRVLLIRKKTIIRNFMFMRLFNLLRLKKAKVRLIFLNQHFLFLTKRKKVYVFVINLKMIF